MTVRDQQRLVNTVWRSFTTLKKNRVLFPIPGSSANMRTWPILSNEPRMMYRAEAALPPLKSAFVGNRGQNALVDVVGDNLKRKRHLAIQSGHWGYHKEDDRGATAS